MKTFLRPPRHFPNDTASTLSLWACITESSCGIGLRETGKEIAGTQIIFNSNVNEHLEVREKKYILLPVVFFVLVHEKTVIEDGKIYIV